MVMAHHAQERLAYLPEAPLDHKAKIDEYNDLLEDIYQREVELTRFKSALTNMRQEISEEVLHLSSTGVLPPVSSATPVEGASKSDSDSEAENALSDSTSGSTGDSKPRRPKTGSKKAKRKFTRHSKVPEAQLDAEWDYQFEVSGKQARRGSAASEKNMQI
jgi:hypothetical protein